MNRGRDSVQYQSKQRQQFPYSLTFITVNLSNDNLALDLDQDLTLDQDLALDLDLASSRSS